MHLLLPLIAAIVFALGSMVYKRAYAEGAGVAHMLVVNNVALSLLFLPLFALESKPIVWSHWYFPCITALAYAIGHLFHILSLRVGDVSLATPLLGAKVIFVALLGWIIFGFQLQTTQWVAAGLATAGVILMGLTDFQQSGRLGRTTALALGCSAAFAVTDITIQKWGDDFGTFNFLPFQFVALAVISLLMLPFLGKGSLKAPGPAWKWIAAAAALSAIQAILITGTIAFWHDATGVNVVYATRGLWSIALVWWLGRHFQNHERATAGGKRIGWRLAGAVLIIGGVVLTSWTGK